MSTPISGAVPELDPSYGQTALATYQELLNRYANTSAAARAQKRIDDLQERFAYKEYRAALYYLKLKAYDSAVLYLKDVVATYPRASIAPDALLKLVEAYRRLGYQEDVKETCGYLRRFHPRAVRGRSPCAADTTGASWGMIGLFGGSFDPVHHGHLLVGQAAAEILGLDSLRFVPAREQPFKRGGHAAPPEHRAAMLDLAVAGSPGLEVERAELEREGPSYTVDTLRALRARDPGSS